MGDGFMRQAEASAALTASGGAGGSLVLRSTLGAIEQVKIGAPAFRIDAACIER